MDVLTNPYAPGAGIEPPELTGRTEIIQKARVTLGRALRGLQGKSFISVGLRGVGKTVVLNKVKRLAEDMHCHVAMIEAHDDKALSLLLYPELRRVLLELDRGESINEKVKTALRALRSFIGTLSVSYGGIELSLGVDPLTGTADSGDIEADLSALFISVGNAAKSKNVVFLLILDEIQYLSKKELSALVMAMHKVSQEGLPIVLIGAGLPVLVGKMGESKSYAERLFEFPIIDALSYEDACQAIIEPARRNEASFSSDALKEIYSLTEGYPFFVQQWAYACWNAASGATVEKQDVEQATQEATTSLDTSFFRVRFDRLTPKEKRYLRAMAELGRGPHRSGEIANKLGVLGNQLGPFRSSLIQKGMIYSPAYGDTAFTVPRFDQYLRRVMPFAHWDDA